MLAHTLLFFLRKDYYREDMIRAERLMASLEKGAYKDIVVYNQGPLTNDELGDYLKKFKSIRCTIIGAGENVGIVRARQCCFEYIWTQWTEIKYVSELHLDMVVTHEWELPLVAFLEANENEPVVGCGIIDKWGKLPFLELSLISPEQKMGNLDEYLALLRVDLVIEGFTHPCIHKLEILRAIGGIDVRLLKGKQSYEDMSLLLGYHYYYGRKQNWKPKVCFRSVIYHEVEAQRMTLGDDLTQNLDGLVRQYGERGMKVLSEIAPLSEQRLGFEKQHQWMQR